jgi:hypothetical protein
LRSGWLSFLLGIVLCLLHFASFCFAIVIVCVPAASTNLFILSFFLSLHFLLIVGCRLVPPSLKFLGAGPSCKPIPRRRPRRCSHSSASASAVLPFLGVGLGGAPIPRRRPRQCSHSSASASAVLPFLGLGSAPIPWRRPRQCSHSSASASPLLMVPRRRPSRCSHSSVPASAVLPFLVGLALGGGPPQFLDVASVVLLGLTSVLRTKPSAPPRCSARNLRPRLGGAPLWLPAFASVLRTKPSALPRRCSSLVPLNLFCRYVSGLLLSVVLFLRTQVTHIFILLFSFYLFFFSCFHSLSLHFFDSSFDCYKILNKSNNPIQITTVISKITTVISKTTTVIFSNYGLDN